MKYFPIQRSTRIIEKFESSSSSLCIVLHGYGQLISFFSRKFASAYPDMNFLFIEGPHRFYLEGNNGRVGASWMTKEDRSLDILENHQAIKEIISFYSSNFQKIHLLGFSQGAATAARFAEENPKLISSLTLWASVFPPDMNTPENLTELPCFLLYGDTDEYYPKEKREPMIEQQLQITHAEVIKYEGGHTIYALPLSILCEKLNSI